MPACACSSSASGAGQPFSTASRSRCNEPTPGLPPQEKISFDDAATADQLVVDEVRRHPDNGQVAPPLADDFMSRRRRDQVREALQGDRVAVANHFPDGFLEWKYMGQVLIMPCAAKRGLTRARSLVLREGDRLFRGLRGDRMAGGCARQGDNRYALNEDRERHDCEAEGNDGVPLRHVGRQCERQRERQRAAEPTPE